MRIIDENGNEMEMYNPDEGFITYETIVIKHHEAQPFIPDIFHYEIVKIYRHRGKDAIRVIDVPGQPAKDAWDETELIMRFHAYSEEEKQRRMVKTDEAEAFKILIGEE